MLQIYKDQNVITQLAWMTYIMNLKGRTLNALKVVYNYTLGPIFGTYQYNPVVQYIDMDSTIDLLLKIHGHQVRPHLSSFPFFFVPCLLRFYNHFFYIYLAAYCIAQSHSLLLLHLVVSMNSPLDPIAIC